MIYFLAILTALFLIYYVYRLVVPYNHTLFQQTMSELDPHVKWTSYQKYSLAIALVLFAEQFIEVVYLGMVLKYDPYKFPTFLMIVWFVLIVGKAIFGDK